MYKDIKIPLKEHFGKTKFDNRLYKKIKTFRLGWTQKSEIYTEFLGSNLLGVHPIRFSTLDDEKLIVDILNINLSSLKEDIYNVKEINPDWNVSSNPIYITLTYMMHRFIKDGDIGSHRDDALRECYYIFAYKAISSLISNYFDYSAKPEIAQVAYERLSKRFLIKKFDSWDRMFEYRANDVLPKGIRYDELKRYNTLDAISIINDLQGRIRDIVKNIYAIIDNITKSNEKISTTSNITIGDDGEVIADIQGRPDVLINNLLASLVDKNNFIQDDLIHIIKVMVTNTDEVLLKKSLVALTEDHNLLKSDKDNMLTPVIWLSIEYLTNQGITGNYTDRVIEVLKYLKGYWTSSKVSNKDVIHIKKEYFKHAKKAINKKTRWVIVTTSLSTILYIFLRSIIKK